MTLTLRLFGELKHHMPGGPRSRATVGVPDGLDVLGLILHLGIPYNVDEGSVVVTVNDVEADHRAPLREGDTVSMFEPLAGG